MFMKRHFAQVPKTGIYLLGVTKTLNIWYYVQEVNSILCLIALVMSHTFTGYACKPVFHSTICVAFKKKRRRH